MVFHLSLGRTRMFLFEYSSYGTLLSFVVRFFIGGWAFRNIFEVSVFIISDGSSGMVLIAVSLFCYYVFLGGNSKVSSFWKHSLSFSGDLSLPPKYRVYVSLHSWLVIFQNYLSVSSY